MNTIICIRSSGLRAAVATVALILASATPLFAQSPQCAQALGAYTKLFDAPFHMYMVDTAGTDARLHGGKPILSEEIFIGGVVYVMVEGKWVKSPVDVQEMRKDALKNLQTTKTTCTHLRDESVNGESASVWKVRAESEDGDSESIAWISKSRNVVLRSEIFIDVGGALGKSHMVSTYSYSNVQAPAGVK